ncbi:MAG: hypothetical protein ACJ77A_15005 [Actinomycetota bacterium]
MKVILAVVLVVLVLLTGLPFAIGMGTDCPSCHPGDGVGPMACAAFLAFFALALAAAAGLAGLHKHRVQLLLLARSFERPPRA